MDSQDETRGGHPGGVGVNKPNRLLVRLGLLHPTESSRRAAKTGLLLHPTLVTHEQLDERLAVIEARLIALEERDRG